jgi:hypothetical protein
MLSRQVAPLLRKFCKVSAYFTIASQRGHALTMLRSFKVILNFSTQYHVANADSSQASSTSTISPISQRRSVTPAAMPGILERLVNADEHPARCLQQPGQRRPTWCIVPAFGHGDQAFALSLFPGSLALRARRRLPPSRGSCAQTVFHTPCDASSHEKRPRVAIDIVVANEYPQLFSDRAAAVFVRGRDVVSDPSRSTDLDVFGRLFTTITDNFIFDRLTVIERTKAGTFDSRDMDEHVSAAVLGLNESTALSRVEPFDSPGRHHGLLESTLSGRTTIVRSLIRNQRVLGKRIRGCATSNARFEPENYTGSHDGFNSVRAAATRDKKLFSLSRVPATPMPHRHKIP